MKRIIVLLVCAFLVGTNESYAQTDQNLEKVLNTMTLYLGETTNRFLVFKSGGLGSRLSHNDAVSVPVNWKYESIKEDLKPLEAGGYVCTDIVIERTFKDFIWINRMKPKNKKEDVYFVLLKYTIIAKYSIPGKYTQRNLTILDTPIEFKRYIILAKDDTDGFFKPIDVYPRVKGEFDFYTIPTVLAAHDITISVQDREKLYAIYLNYK